MHMTCFLCLQEGEGWGGMVVGRQEGSQVVEEGQDGGGDAGVGADR